MNLKARAPIVVAGALASLSLPLCGLAAQAPAGLQPSDAADAADAASGYVADLAKLNAAWPGEPVIETLEDAFRVRVVLGETILTTDSHLFGGAVNIIPYHNEDNVRDALGTAVERGDSVIARYFPPDDIGFAIKHHRPRYRSFGTGGRTHTMKEEFKLRDTHIEIVIGVMRDGVPGAITLSSPQGYERGRFGSVKYPMIFVRPVYPSHLSAAETRAYRDNLRTMMVGMSAVSKFPASYSGGDPLAARSPRQVSEHAAMMVRAIAGDEDARAWFRKKENLIYCAELAHLASSAGLLTPLNERTFVPLVGESVWQEFVRQLNAHNRGKPSAFTRLNKNPHVARVRLSLAPEDLVPLRSHASHPRRPRRDFSAELAFVPMTISDMIELFLQIHLPRRTLGEDVAPLQGELLAAMKPGAMEALRVHRLAPDHPRRILVEELFDEIVAVVRTPHEDYQAFRTALEPRFVQARCLTGPRGDSGDGLFIPPSLFHVIAQGRWPGGLLGLRYVGHGLHFSLVYQPSPAGDGAKGKSQR